MVIALIALVLLGFWLLVNPNYYKDKIAAAVKDAASRDLMQQGDIKLSVFPWIALELGLQEQFGKPCGRRRFRLRSNSSRLVASREGYINVDFGFGAVNRVTWQTMTTTTKQFTEQLLEWFDAHGRKNLPWQREPTTYRVWVSEVMLQQTQVATVIPYFERFIARFPNIESLAAAPEDEVLHLWTGLGYYARARNLRVCAQTLVAKHGGEFPTDIEAVMALRGIGRSTAGAILALSRGQRHPILDGNVKRVLARVFGIAGSPSAANVLSALWEAAEACTPTARVGAYTQAIMDLGATLCTRTRPACTVCPMNGICIAAREGRQMELPGRKQRRERRAREATLLIAETGSVGKRAVLLERRPAPGIWGGLWSPPQFESEFAALDWCRREIGEPEMQAEQMAPIDHAFTHFDLRLTPVRVRCKARAQVREADDRLWYSLSEPPRVGLPQPILQLFARLRSA